MIKALSPYYVTTPFVTPGGGLFPAGVTCSKYELEIFIWTGNRITDVPSTETYSITIENPTESDGNSIVNISDLILPYIDFTPTEVSTTELKTKDNQVWVRTQVKYYIADLFVDYPFHKDTQLALRGWGTGLGGSNQDTPSNKILLSDTSLRYTMADSDSNGYFIVPIELDEISAPDPEIVVTSITQDGTTLDADVVFTSVGTYEEFYCIATVVSSSVSAILTMSGTTSPQTITFPGYVEYNVVMYGYDTATNTNVSSNTINITLSP